MKLRKIALGVLPLAAAGALALGGVAHATVNPSVIYTSTSAEGGNAVAGWAAITSNVDFTHIQSYVGNTNLESLPAVTALAGEPAGYTVYNVQNGTADTGRNSGPIPFSVGGGAGVQLCSNTGSSKGDAAQIGEVNVGGGKFDVVEALGTFGGTALNSDNDVCDNGLLGSAPGSEAILLKVLLTGVGSRDTIWPSVLYDFKDAYTAYDHHGHAHHVAAGDVTFNVQDLTNPTNVGIDSISVPAYLGHNVVTNEADAGLVSNSALSLPITGFSVPTVNNHATESLGPDEAVRFAHVQSSGNSITAGGREISGDSFQGNSAWSVYPVASTQDGTATSALKENPSQFFADNFFVQVGPSAI